MKSRITIGTRSSKLAMWQANYVKEGLRKFYPDLEITLKEIKTKGDHISEWAHLGAPLPKVEGKGFFTKEIEDELLNGEIDLAAHSLKDLPTKLVDGLKIGAVLKRENPYDVLITKQSDQLLTFKNLPEGARLGTSSLRRIAQLKAIRSDLEYLDLRGNLDTRIKKLHDGLYDAIVLAYAGVKRLGFEDSISEHFDPKEILPAVGQGAMAIEIRDERTEGRGQRAENRDIEDLVSKLNHNESYLCSVAERSFLEALQGGCQVPIGAYSEIKEGKITLYGMIASMDGKRIVRDKITSNVILSASEGSPNVMRSFVATAPQDDTLRNLGKQLAEGLLQNGGDKILNEIRNLEMSNWGVSTGV